MATTFYEPIDTFKKIVEDTPDLHDPPKFGDGELPFLVVTYAYTRKFGPTNFAIDLTASDLDLTLRDLLKVSVLYREDFVDEWVERANTYLKFVREERGELAEELIRMFYVPDIKGFEWFKRNISIPEPSLLFSYSGDCYEGKSLPERTCKSLEEMRDEEAKFIGDNQVRLEERVGDLEVSNQDNMQAIYITADFIDLYPQLECLAQAV